MCIDGDAPEVVKGLLADVLNQRDGLFIIAGHTDDIPIKTRRFRSNWDLSAARAASVVHYFIQEGDVEISVLHGNRHAIAGESPASNVDYVGQTKN